MIIVILNRMQSGNELKLERREEAIYLHVQIVNHLYLRKKFNPFHKQILSLD